METKEILIFSITDKQYGVEVGGLQGIENYIPPTEVAGGPQIAAGVVKIRQEVYPVIDLRKMFCLPVTEATDETKYLILNTQAGQVACIVDSVIEIFTGRDKEIQPFPTMLRTQGTQYADCIMKVHDKLVVVMDSARLFDEVAARELVTMAKKNEE